MAVKADNVWKIGFWIITGGLVILTSNVIANDRIRACEDQRIEDSISPKLDAMRRDITDIKVSLARLESKQDRP